MDPTRSLDIGDYKIVFENEQAGPQLTILKNDKTLKSVPALIRKTAEYKELKQHFDEAKKQYSRIRRRLEEMMANGEDLTAKDLTILKTLPAGQNLLESLILRTADGHYGLLNFTENSLCGVGREHTVPLSTTAIYPLQIAHAIQLHKDRMLAAWQAEIVHRQITQPFKQAFREIYLLTDAERKTETYSNRFHGRIINAPVAARLLTSRDWKTSCQREIMVHRVFGNLKIVAELKLTDYGHYFTESGDVTTDILTFTPTPPDPYHSETPLKLETIDPQIFSEVLRDVDLVASVAYVGESYWISPNSLVVRKELLHALVNDLEVSGVQIEGKYALIHGSRTNYRVHLETGAIYVGSGNHICVVPEKSKAIPEEIYLPFVADEDFKLREIMSRILMLLNDENIKDKVILNQIDEALGDSH